MTPATRPHATHARFARSLGTADTPVTTRGVYSRRAEESPSSVGISATAISGVHRAHATWHHRPVSAHCANAPSCTGQRMHDTPRNIASFSPRLGRIEPGDAVAAAAATAGVFSFPRRTASRQGQHVHPAAAWAPWAPSRADASAAATEAKP